MSGYEINIDGLVGPTHHYAGLSFGNEASTAHRYQAANPKLAAQQGLLKMWALTEMGLSQAVFAPQQRPHLPTLRQLGFYGTTAQMLQQAYRYSPDLLSNLCSGSSMWTANAATVGPSADSRDGRLHFTAANLNNKFHRSIEHHSTSQILAAMFRDEEYFCHHQALPAVALFGDEGAANHNRLGGRYDRPSVQVFVYGQQHLGGGVAPTRYPARQSLEASQAIARLHELNPAQTVFVQQNPAVIDQGVFHNDVIAVSNQQVLFYHQEAFLNSTVALAEIEQKMAALGEQLIAIEVPSHAVSVADAVASYVFNSQLISRPDGKMSIVVPQEATENIAVWQYLKQMVAADYPIDEIKVFDLRESMRNGGGPACLRLRVAVNAAERQAMNPRVFLTAELFEQLNQWIERHYRDRLLQQDLVDPQLLQESYRALDELTQILDLGSVYAFQQL
ncbi:N-succinylarginine dihydrolase [Acinetobacter larvae]|uniref:N-succinylarginine dihydrolase n=1 Tax=Acinetobacter larvae TaxID=1789224 RepID=A0A1B2LX43_9GAMM|nr:N-succinylarginine dihydrolase [Acinetobacter larvae]AOA57507.1 N-succinylarginine dihydrolase [Acinetobacter larvae]